MKYLNFLLGASLILSSMTFAGTRDRANAAYDEFDDSPSYSQKSKKKSNKSYEADEEESSSAKKKKKKKNSESSYSEEGSNAGNSYESKSLSALGDDFPLPVIMVLPSVSAKGTASLQVVSNNPFAKAAMDGVNEFLTKNHYEVKSLEGSDALDNVIQVQNTLANTDEDLAYLASLVLNADVYVKFAGGLTTKGVNVTLNAYESSTARLLGTQNIQMDCGRDKNEQQATLKNAAKAAMKAMEPVIVSYWQDDLKKGNKYKVIMNIKGDYDDSALEDLQDDITSNLKGAFKKTKVNTMTAKTIDMIIYSPSDDVNEVYSTIRRTIKSIAPTKKINISKKLIIMDIQ